MQLQQDAQRIDLVLEGAFGVNQVFLLSGHAKLGIEGLKGGENPCLHLGLVVVQDRFGQLEGGLFYLQVLAQAVQLVVLSFNLGYDNQEPCLELIERPFLAEPRHVDGEFGGLPAEVLQQGLSETDDNIGLKIIIDNPRSGIVVVPAVVELRSDRCACRNELTDPGVVIRVPAPAD